MAYRISKIFFEEVVVAIELVLFLLLPVGFESPEISSFSDCIKLYYYYRKMLGQEGSVSIM